MIFKTPCFVRVEDAEKRKELIEWLKDIGYDVCVCCSFNENQYLSCSNIERNGQLVGEAHGVYNCDEIPDTDIVGLFLEETTDYDCGTDIELFMAIAAMNDPIEVKQKPVGI